MAHRVMEAPKSTVRFAKLGPQRGYKLHVKAPSQRVRSLRWAWLRVVRASTAAAVGSGASGLPARVGGALKAERKAAKGGQRRP